MRFYVEANEDFGERIGRKKSRNLSCCYSTVPALITLEVGVLEIQPLFKLPEGSVYLTVRDMMIHADQLRMVRCVNGDKL